MVEVVLVRHGETEWSKAGRHTGRTDVPLTAEGRHQAERVRGQLAGRSFSLVLTSPLSRARETCHLAGLGDRAECCDDLVEWDYGSYEGATTEEIRRSRPGWTVFSGGAPGGETAERVGQRVDRVIARIRSSPGDVALFAHAHVLRVLAARWLGLEPTGGRFFALATASVSVLGEERETSVIRQWNL
ncbi:MAG TPA: histidine phosphatase family protein [Myxococcota bacterium]|nr:histidine phosphatase family protein [Myxococcota bacterium]